jgi:hypothetical protein
VKRKTVYELTNDVIRAYGVENPDTLSETERMSIVMKHVLMVAKWKKDKKRNDKT